MLPQVFVSLVRLRTPFAGWSFTANKSKHLLHIGAHLCEENNDYLESGCEFVSWVEANVLNIDSIPDTIDPGAILWSAITDSNDSTISLKISENSVSSSIFNLVNESDFVGVNVVNEITVPTITLNSAIAWANNRVGQKVDFLVLDIQGAEGLALSMPSELLFDISAISIEVSRRGLYSTEQNYSYVKARLAQFGFSRTLTFINPLNGHGDELWINRSNPLYMRLSLKLFSIIRSFIFFLFKVRGKFFSKEPAY